MPATQWHLPFIVEVLLRVTLYILFRVTDDAEPFHRKIQPEEMWLYKNPRTDSYVPTRLLWTFVFGCPALVIGVFYLIRRDIKDVIQATLGVTLSIWLTGTVTNCIKLGAGRPRPDFFYRCFPDGHYVEEMKCTGSPDAIRDGMKSFPSGHSSLSFSSLMYTFLYLAGKLHCFTWRGRGQSWRLCLSLAPLLIATMIAVSRTADYHHHWQDVLIGSLLGICIAYLCYHQFYPAINKNNSHLAYVQITPALDKIKPATEVIPSGELSPPAVSPPIQSTLIDFSSGLKHV
ncbi:phospholipid phosphatase 5-like [Liolophura sinensis]|uniref:phospholipid phosphatase 5-like n=1 Tax=Liolophura sinensis TaxID=3198878 RepID=UPI003158C57F